MTRRTDDFADLRRVLAQPAKTHPEPLLGEGTHIRPDGFEFHVAWRDFPTMGGPAWYWWRDDEATEGPFNTAHAAYLAAFHKES